MIGLMAGCLLVAGEVRKVRSGNEGQKKKIREKRKGKEIESERKV